MGHGFTDRDVPDQAGRTIMVTGANRGIGFEAAVALAGAGARVLLACRDQQRATVAAAAIRDRVPGADLGVVQLDLASLDSVAAAAAGVRRDESRLDVLVNNAGVLAPPLTRTEDGLELQFAVNHVATFALTGRLLPMLREQQGSRVVSTSSIAHRRARLLLDDPHAERGYARMERYASSKLATLVFALELDRRLRASGARTASVACHPGFATTDIAREVAPWLGWVDPVLRPVARVLCNTAAQGAWPTLMAATDPGVQGGEYLGPTRRGETAGPAGRAEVAAQARDEDDARALWDLSVDLTGIDPIAVA